MKCPRCDNDEDKVLDSRSIREGAAIRRRRECLSCAKRFTTFEVIETMQIVVAKKNGAKELFDRTKLMGGILKATQKRPVDAEQIVNEIEAEIQNALKGADPNASTEELVRHALRAMVMKG